VNFRSIEQCSSGLRWLPDRNGTQAFGRGGRFTGSIGSRVIPSSRIGRNTSTVPSQLAKLY
jgi:hypothetical protein